MKKIKGSCLCKSISFEIINECRYSILCHCTMCQKSNAEFSNYTKVQKNNFKFLGLSVVALIVFYFCRNQMDLQFLVLIHFTIISTACLIQYFSLYKKNIIFS